MENTNAVCTNTEKLPYNAPALVEYGSVRELTQEASVLGFVVSVVAAVL
jgi:hypothetical protein